MANENLPGHIRAFFNPASYPHPVKDVQFIQTHISWIFLTGEVAYKIKKPVDLGFVNFSTLVKRKKTCEAEISLNRRLAPDIYLDLLSIYKEGDAYRMGGNSNRNHRIIDYAIKMVQFSQHDLFDVRLQQGHFNPAW
ncbi:MAG: hypothetical protein ACE5E3_02410, partial [Mariprofundus sp.]